MPIKLSWTKGVMAGTALIFALHACGLVLLFNPISGLVNTQPVIEQDWGLHAQHLDAMQNFWQQDGRLWGYNPFYMAGYPSNTIQDLSVKFFELLAIPASAIGINAMLAFKLLVFFVNAAIPWMFSFAARNFFGNGGDAPLAGLLAALLGTACWWNSLSREMFFYGMVGFPPASCLLLLALSFLFRALRSGRALSWAHGAWAASLAVLIPMHLQAALILIPLAVILILVERRRLTAAGSMWLLTGAVFAVTVNLAWLLPLFNHRGDDISKSLVTQLPLFLSSDPFTFLKDYLGPAGYWTFRVSFWEKGLRWMALILGMAGAVRLMRSGRRELAVFMIGAVSSLFALAYFGSLIPWIRGWQPLRFKVPYDLFLVLPAAFFLTSLKSGSWSKRGKIPARILLACGVLSFLTNVIQTESNPRLRLRTGISADVNEILDWIRTQTPQNARLLFEESGDETGFVYDGMYLSSFIPRMTGRKLIGGPINLYNDRHHFAEMHSARLFKRDIAAITDEELAAYLRVYNIGAAVVFHPRSVQRLLARPDLVSVDRKIGPVHLMKIHQPLNWFLRGEGEVDAGWNRIHVSHARGDELLLKYHWVEGLVASPPLQIVPERVLDDPIPFIRILRPPSEFTLRIER